MKRADYYSNYALNIIKEICNKFGPRYSCSEEELKTNQWVREELNHFCNDVTLDTFKTHPHFYPQGIIILSSVFFSLGLLFIPLAFPYPILSTIMILSGAGILVLELMFLRGWFSFLFPKKISSNVFGSVKPKKQIRKKVIIEGHTDSAKQMPLANYERSFPVVRFSLGMGYILFTFIFSIAKVIVLGILNEKVILFSYSIFVWTKLDWYYYGAIIILFPFFIVVISGLIGEDVVMGANDNLSGTAIAIATGKYFVDHPLEHVELIIGSMGSEEVGEKGAEYFIKTHPELVKDAFILVLDAVGAGSELCIVERDFMHFSKYDDELIELVTAAYKEYQLDNPQAVEFKQVVLPMGSSDASRYAKKGLKSTFLVARAGEMNKPANWHTITDTFENIEKKMMTDVLGIVIEFVEMIDDKYKDQ